MFLLLMEIKILMKSIQAKNMAVVEETITASNVETFKSLMLKVLAGSPMGFIKGTPDNQNIAYEFLAVNKSKNKEEHKIFRK